MIEMVQMIGIGAATASVASFVPQAWKIIKTRDVEGLSSGMYMLTAVAFGLWLAFGTLKSEWSLIVPNALCLFVTLFILAMILADPKVRDRVADKLDPDLEL